MQTWAKRGLQTALVTGGLLMLGTGIASADEDVNPDRPASPLDGSLNIPVNIDNNVVGTPFGPMELPSVTHGVDVSLSDLGNVPGVVSEALEPVLGSGGCTTECAPAEATRATEADAFRGNRVNGDLVVPFDVSGNAIGVLGDAAVENTSSQTVDRDRPVVTHGHDLLAGNVVDLDYALPVQITGNAVSGIGNAAAKSSSTQEASATGDLDSDGSFGTLAGNVLAGQGATPVQVTGNAVSGIGTAEAESDASTEGAAGGTIRASGQNGFGSGNVGGVPLGFPLEVNGNAVGGAASTGSESDHTAKATAGREELGRYDRPTYIQTNGDPAAVAGNVVEPALSGPASVECNAGSVLAISDASCTSDSPTAAGGTVQTTGSESLAAGNVVAPSAALPTEGFANAVTGGGEATANEDNTVSSDAGGSTFTYGNDSVASGTVIAPTASGPVDIFTNAGAGAGTADATAENRSTTTAGGESGTSGPNSLGGGNIGSVPVALPTEGFGNTAGGLGEATSSVTETKVSTSGGTVNTDDAGGFLAANELQGALSGPAQVGGNGAGVVGNTTSSADADNTVTAGGDNIATGTAGTLAGNIGQAAVALPAQLYGSNATAGGIGTADAVVDTASTAGGHAQTDGAGGLGTGNVATVPAGSALQGFGDSAAAVGQSTATGDSTTSSTAGGDTKTNGTAGTVAGNVVGGHLLPVAQGFGAAAAGVGGLNEATGVNTTDAMSGGDIATTGDRGTISGNLVDLPLAAVAQPFGDAASAVGSDATATGDNTTTGVAGGTSTTSGVGGFLSGLDGTVPLGANVPVYDVPVEVLANALTAATQVSQLQVGEAEPAVNLAITGDSVPALGITDMPRLPEVPAAGEPTALPAAPDLSLLPELTDLSEVSELSGMPQPGARSGLPVPGLGPISGLFGGLLGGVGGGMPAGDLTGGLPGGGVPGLDMLGGLTGLLGGASGGAPGLPQLPGAAAPQPKIGAPALPGSGLRDLPELPGLADLADLDGLAGLESVGELVDALVDGDLGELPTLSEVGDVSELPGAPDVSDLPGLGNLPGVPGIPAVPGLPNLTEVPVAQLPTVDRLPLHTPALSGLDTSTVLNPESATLADTRSKLALLFAQH
ncbi:MAG TPA: hypothetical protein VGX25_13070 [Actinophytocola sp.]|uniref:beta strand repeat-containing protein n=1 Tax=Actinophytocola sp. TaxID=1872138 RepID=UPI002DDCCE0B|nr:hypothetical protein [Actinophytocola sp.]HEV2780317.1 hypothetical protein [Actinophytocola sp.]